MDKKKQLDHWKALYNDWISREEEIGNVFGGERIYIFEVLDYLEPAVRDMYSLDKSDWNSDLIYDYLRDAVDYDTFLSFSVKVGESYEGLRGMSGGGFARYWREPFLVVNNDGGNADD